MWDSMYDTFQLMGDLEHTNQQGNQPTKYESIDIEAIEKDTGLLNQSPSIPIPCKLFFVKINLYMSSVIKVILLICL